MRRSTNGSSRRPGWRAGVLAAATVALVSAGTAVGVPISSAATIDPAAWYQLVSRHSGKAIDICGQSTADGACVQQWAASTTQQNQQFQFVDSGGGFYRLRARHSGKVIDISGNSTADGASVAQWPDNNAVNQQFRVVDTDSGYVTLLNRNSGKALDVWAWSTADGGRISQFTDTGGWNQQWQLVNVGSGGGGGGGSCGSGSFNAEAVLSGSTWTARNGSTTVFTGSDMRAAVQAAVNSLSPGRTAKQRVVVRGSGTVSAGSRISLPSYTVLDVCGTINVTGSGSGDQAPVYARGATDVEVQHLTLTGAPLYGIFLRNVSNVVLGQIDMRLSGGLGIRVDNHGGDRAVRVRNIRIGTVFVSGSGTHAVETYGVDGLSIDTVTTRNVRDAGLLLNDTVNATVGTVDAENTATGTGYAAFRMANRNGRIGSSYPTNIRVGTVIARGGGRGVFCVSESGGAVIDRVDIANTGNNSILIENCHNVTVAGITGTVSGGGEIRIAARSEFPPSSNITFQNLTVTNTNITWSPCSGSNNITRDITRNNSALNWC